ncbi:MAG: ATP-binding protein [Pantoea sp.]|uniref:sensor histidine kinase n=1 Tax=Pantoea sp. TaxID=69393 RepID=UPI00239D6FA7|nr:ATP-binding protein [Pantoea sp.]MDE1188011.1 ATP-binding protein [Pantoea sp.]
MESLKKRLSDSVQFRLSFVLCMAIGGIALLSGVLGFLSAWDEAHELQDSSLQQIASLAKDGMLTPRSSSFISPPLQDEESSRILVHYILPGDQAPDRFGWPRQLPAGFYTLPIDHHSYRVLIEEVHDGIRLAVAQRASVRESVALWSALRTLVPFCILFPVLLYLAADLVRKIFRPIRKLAEDVDRQNDDLSIALSNETIPREITPFITAINRLLKRAAESVELQRRFVADAAHELRSPLTALMLQAERLESAAMPDESRQRLMSLREGMKRAAWLVEQLLSLSRAQGGEISKIPAPEDIAVFDVVKQVISDLHPLAEQKSIDIGVVGASQAKIAAHPSALYTVLRNIVHNAILYTPAEGRIDIGINNNETFVFIEVEDSGPGIPIDKRERVFDAFYRIEGSDVTGSGLGLSIVSAMVARMKGEVTLTDADQAISGLKVSITLPLS